MSRYIDADMLQERCDRFLDLAGDTAIHLEDVIDGTPAVDVMPVVHAHWEYNPNGMDWNLGAWECSACGCRNNNIGGDEKLNPLLFSGSKYCPHCGAKMDEVSEET